MYKDLKYISINRILAAQKELTIVLYMIRRVLAQFVNMVHIYRIIFA